MFTKMCGTGNDFLITDETRLPPSISVNDLIQKVETLCHPKFGLGTDGLCILTKTSNHVWQWQFFNKDGSMADMCGNAACCIVQYAFYKKLTKDHAFTFQIKDKILTGIIHHNKEVHLKTDRPQRLPSNEVTMINGQKIPANHIHSGVEHILVAHSDIKNLEKIRPLAQSLRKKHQNANITFYHSHNNQIQCASFERGVEDFTLACGTGALAVAYQLHPNSHTPITVQMPGGDLKILFDKTHAFLICTPHLVAEISPIIYK